MNKTLKRIARKEGVSTKVRAGDIWAEGRVAEKVAEVQVERVKFKRNDDRPFVIGDGHGGAKGYDVILDGKVVGYVVGARHTSSTTYKGTRIRRDTGAPMGWSFYRNRVEADAKVSTTGEDFDTYYDWHKGTMNSGPGMYESTRKLAAVKLLKAWIRAQEIFDAQGVA